MKPAGKDDHDNGQLDRTTVIARMYQGYLAAHDLLVEGTRPADIPELAEFSERLDASTVFRFDALGIELRGREAIEQFMVESRQSLGLRETQEHVVEHGDLVISLNRTVVSGPQGESSAPVVAVFQFEGERVAAFWGFAA